ncbi:MAG: hypothetical protein H0V66_12185 [Bdellovibrionales bacterium]|nr:hypothetical protein [Bdellovibrionales bacterium]
MTDLLAQVTPLTKGIIWITSGEITIQNKFYKEIDYLLNGLLTATLNSTRSGSHVLLSENFGNNFYVLAGNIESSSLKNYLELVKPHLNVENQVLLIDESDSFKDLKKSIPSELLNKIQPIQ